MRLRSLLTLCAVAASLSLTLAGCGQSSIKGALSPGSNSQLTGELSSVGDAVTNGSCSGAKTGLAKLDATLSDLPSGTNASLVANLKQGAATLRGLALSECHASQTTTSKSSSSSSSTTSSSSSSSTSTTPTTVTTTTTSTSTTNTNTLPGTGTVTQLHTPTTASTSTSHSSTNGGGGLGGQ